MAPGTSVRPRWEWRAFADRFADIEHRVVSGPHEHRETQELYIVCSESDANVKIRHGVLDVKTLLRVDRDLELWTPVLKASFPIEADTAASVFALWKVAPTAIGRPSFTLDQFLAEAVAPVPQLRTAGVAKVRRSTVIEGCSVEVATITVFEQTMQTAAVEGEDPEKVLRHVRGLNLSAYGNVNYVNALKQVLHMDATPAHPRAQEGALS